MTRSNAHFRKGSSTYTCRSCGKLTRETGHCESGVELCAACYDEAGWENEHQDGGHAEGSRPDVCPMCRESDEPTPENQKEEENTMNTFTQKVNHIAATLELDTKKALADELGVNASTLGSALKTDAEGEYTGALTEPVDAKYTELMDEQKDATDELPSEDAAERAAPRGKLNDLRKVGVCDWRAEINGEQVVIQKDAEAKIWVGRCNLDEDPVHIEEKTFKRIIEGLRTAAEKLAPIEA